MHISPETKHKIVKALPWILGGAVVIFVIYRLMAGKSAGGSTAQNLGAPGMQTYGSGQTVDQTASQGATTSNPIAAITAPIQQFANSIQRHQAMAQPGGMPGLQFSSVNKQQGAATLANNPAYNTGAFAINTNRNQLQLFGPGTSKAQQSGTVGHQSSGGFLGSIGSFIRNSLFGGAPVTLGNTLMFGGGVASMLSGGTPRGAMNAANGTTRPMQPSLPNYTAPFAPSNQGQQLPGTTGGGWGGGAATPGGYEVA